ncbi:MarR family transcriptional regulator [Cellulosimicrobium protaetiae]|uniref:MarR family transcriptional regulator n=1 Tax=Cellulosimicrobium protaetiae TaxID=2587808 RepID=A0A6M5UCF9_9MICO|nr:MarR family transcriptional regulator [Cellulosimicrobium protaetiae]QJW35930.1 MarR family transcriptional regulator [Cellulosimicrobium protaetiae]
MTDQESPPPGPPERPIGYWLKLVDRLIDENLDGVFQHSGLTRRHWQVLNTIRDGVSETTAIDGVLSPFTGGASGATAAVAAEVDDLVRRGWVARSDAGLAVTVAGNHAYHDLLDAVSLSRERVAEGVSREEYAQTVATLERMARNLGRQG